MSGIPTVVEPSGGDAYRPAQYTMKTNNIEEPLPIQKTTTAEPKPGLPTPILPNQGRGMRPKPHRRSEFIRVDELNEAEAHRMGIPDRQLPNRSDPDSWSRERTMSSSNKGRLASTGTRSQGTSYSTGTSAHEFGATPSGTKKVYNFLDIVDMDQDDLYARYVAEGLVGQLIESVPFRLTILFIIVLNTILIGLQTDATLSARFTGVLSAIDSMFLTVFVVEIALKWYAGFEAFWKTGWNVFDFLIVAASLFAPSLTFFSSGRVLRVLRVIRAFRTLRSISALQGLQVIVQTIIRSLPDMANIVALLLIVMFIFSVIGVTIFGSQLPEHFGSLSENMFTLFILTTQDGWVGIFEKLEARGLFASAAIYFGAFITIGAFVFANIIVGVTVTNLQVAYEEIARTRKARNRRLRRHKREWTADVRESIGTGRVPSSVWGSQTPDFVPDWNNISLPAVENYFLVLSAMEDNLVEYSQLKESLEKLTTEIGELNEDAGDLVDGYYDEDQDSDGREDFESHGPGRRWLADLIEEEDGEETTGVHSGSGDRTSGAGVSGRDDDDDDDDDGELGEEHADALTNLIRLRQASEKRLGTKTQEDSARTDMAFLMRRKKMLSELQRKGTMGDLLGGSAKKSGANGGLRRRNKKGGQ